MNKELIAQLRNGEIAVENNGSLEQLREVLKAADSPCYYVSGLFRYYANYFRDIVDILGVDTTHLPTVPITDFFKEDRAVELLRELVRTFHRKFLEDSINKDDWNKRVAEKNAAFANAEQFLNELNKDK